MTMHSPAHPPIDLAAIYPILALADRFLRAARLGAHDLSITPGLVPPPTIYQPTAEVSADTGSFVDCTSHGPRH
jgi:hypothetical protein